MKRLRRTPALRRLVSETRLAPCQFVHPLFIHHGRDVETPIASLAGHSQRSPDRLAPVLDTTSQLGVNAVLLFGIPSDKDPNGSSAWDHLGPVLRAIQTIKSHAPHTVVIADVCLCEYTSHGHCGVLRSDNSIDNDATLPLLAHAAVAYADAGADIVAPSAMMDGQVAAIRAALDRAGHCDVAIMSYSAKFASAFYGPFRDAAQSTPAFGDRRGYQLDPANIREAIGEAEEDEREGADIVMVKPAGPYLDVIADVRANTKLPLAAYQVSGEYAMLKAAAERGWLCERTAALESLTAIKRAGADIIITYYAHQAARWLAAADE